MLHLVQLLIKICYSNMEKWNCKTVVITGANSGIGLATLNKLAAGGMKAVGFDLQTDNIEVMA